MEAIKLNCTLEEQISKKGTKYTCLTVKLTPTLEKKIFLDPAEVEVVRLYSQISSSGIKFDTKTGEIK